MREIDKTRYQQIKTSIDIAHVASNYGICIFVGLISIGMLLVSFFLLAPPFVNTTRSLSYLLDRGNNTLDQVDLVLNYHNKILDKLETKINITLNNADVLLDQASQVLDQVTLIIQYIENHLPFFPHNNSQNKKIDISSI